MKTTRTLLAPISLLIVVAGALSSLLALHGQALAANGPKVLTLSDMGAESGCINYANQSIAGAKYAHGIMFSGGKNYVILFPHTFPGYNTFTAAVGVPDGSSAAGTESLLVTVDGKPFKTLTKSSGQAATILTVPFGAASQIKLTTRDNQKNGLYILLGNPTVRTTAPTAVATPEPINQGGNGSKGKGGGTTTGGSTTGKTTLQLFSASVAAGSQETALITTGANASVTIVINYPNGTQQVEGPKKAGADGHFAYSWNVPGGMAGITRVLVDSSGVAQGTFTIK